MQDVASVLSVARATKRLSKAEVARRCVATRPDVVGFHDRAVAYWERGERLPTLEQFAILARVLDIEPIACVQVLHQLAREPAAQVAA